jgi:hypothetical protein
MKLYTLLIPTISVVAVVALYHACKRIGRMARFVPYAALLAATATGGVYVSQYLNQAQVATPDMLSLYRLSNERRFDNFALITDHLDIAEFMYAPLISMYWVNGPTPQTFLARILDKDVVVAVRPGDACRQCLATYFAGNIIYEDSSTLFINTGLPLRDFCEPAVRSQIVDELGTDATKQWLEVKRNYDGTYVRSYHQCDYGYLWKLLYRAYNSGS